MRIDELIGKPALPTASEVKKNTRPEQAFSDLLAEQLKTSTAAATEQTLGVEGASQSPWPVGAATTDPAAAQRVASEIENALNQWADISELVAAPNGSPKEIQSRIGSLLDSGQALQKKLEALPEAHPLRRIADELNVFATVESIKWQRGDYV